MSTHGFAVTTTEPLGFQNSSNGTWLPPNSDLSRLEAVIKIAVPLSFSFIVLLAIIGNSLVILVVACNKQMRNTTNLLIINLAFADLFFVVICAPCTAITYTTTQWPLGVFLCKLNKYVSNVTAYASVYTLVMMSLDRYLAVVHPIRSMTIRNVKNCTIVIIILWVIICCANVPVYIINDVYSYNFYEEVRSACMSMVIKNNGKPFYGCFFAFAFMLPLTLVCILYGSMIKRLLRGVGGSGEVSRGKKRVTRMVVAVVAAFAICWLPNNVMFMIIHFGKYPTNTTFIAIQITSNCLAYMNSCINPILYAFLSDNFRQSFRKLLCPSRWKPVRLEFERTCNPKSAGLITRTTTVLNNNE